MLVKKKLEMEESGKLFSRKGNERVQRVVAVVPLTEDVKAETIVERLLEAVGVEMTGEGGYRNGECVLASRLSRHRRAERD